ncbi:hypothetical protein, partial [Eubacterium aggregans]|uniref:hypothetical protein n=1 Tax=Eubacterium aggregans TaxID=81409 RepID=UPI003F2FBC3F
DADGNPSTDFNFNKITFVEPYPGFDIHLSTRNALEITEEEITVTAAQDAHILIIEMRRSQ